MEIVANRVGNRNECIPMKIEMKPFVNIYFAMTSRLKEIIKGLICVFLLCCSSNVSNALVTGIEKRYGVNHVDYFLRIIVIIAAVVLLVIGVKLLHTYIRKNTESLLLLGLTEGKILALFFIKHYELLFAFAYVGTLLGNYQEMNFVTMLLVNTLNTIVFGGFITILYLISKYPWSRCLLYALVVAGAIVFSFGMVNYENAYKLLMSSFADAIFGEIYLQDVWGKGLLLLLFFLIVRNETKRNGLMIETDKRKQISDNPLGDYLHRMGKHFSFRKEYVWMYRDKDFLIWKIFSAVFYAFICVQTEGVLEPIVCGYVICLVTTSYLLNIYQLDRKQLLIYYLSDFSFTDLLKSHVKSGVAIMGDTLIVISVFCCIQNIRYVVVLVGLILIILLVGVYIYTAMYAKYNRRIYLSDYIVILIKMHIPIWNIRSWYVNYNRGKENWSKLSYERQ